MPTPPPCQYPGACTTALLTGCASLLGAKEKEVKYAADSLLASLRNAELSRGMAATVRVVSSK